MKELNNYIIEKLKLNKDVQGDSSNTDDIEGSLTKIFKDNKAFNQNKEEIFKLINNIYAHEKNKFTSEEYLKMHSKHIICYCDYNEEFKKYLKKFNIDTDLLTPISKRKKDDLEDIYFGSFLDFSKNYKEGKTYIYFNSKRDYISLESGLEGNGLDDVLNIYILPKYEIER